MKIKGDTNAVIQFSELFFDSEDLVAITAINSKTEKLVTQTFKAKNKAAISKFIDRYNGICNLYFSVNQPKTEIRKKATRRDIKTLNYLHVDIDPRAGEDHEQERERIRKIFQDIEKLNLPKPTFIIDSGGGYQLFWRLSPSVEINGDLELAEKYKKYNVQIAHLTDGDSCYSIDHIMRLPGTVNIPNTQKRKRGRTEALAKLFEYNDVSYELEKNFTSVLIRETQELNNHCASTKLNICTSAKGLNDVDELDQYNVPDRIKVVIVQGHDPDNPKPPEKDGTRSGWLFDVVCNLVRYAVPDNVIFAIITDPIFRISESILDKGSNSKKYALRQIERAKELAEDFICDKYHKPYNNQHNIRVALHKLGHQLSYDEFSNRLLIDNRHLNEADVTRLYLEIELKFKFRPTKDYFWMVIEDCARQDSFHPIREYLDSLHWDGVSRLDNWLFKYGGAKDSPFVRAAGRIVLIAAVRRIRQPGTKFDEMLVLESNQGMSKSEALSILAIKPEWFSDDLPLNADSKRQIESIAGRWIVEADELKGMRKGDVEHLKSFLSRRVDRARLAYDRYVTEIPRQCIVIGTTNSERYLRDNTGNRRFWPVKVEIFDLLALKRDVGQLWAEAAYLEKQNDVSIRLDKSLWQFAADEQEKRHVEDPFVITLTSALGDQKGKLRATVAWDIIGVPLGQRTQEHNARLGEALRILGFSRIKRRFGGSPEWCYVRGDKKEQRCEIVVGRWTDPAETRCNF